jgi:hypothetical protein
MEKEPLPVAGQRNSSHEARISVLESQYHRIASDIESEKRTRADANSHVNRKIDQISEHIGKQDKILYVGMGILAMLQFIAPYFILRR